MTTRESFLTVPDQTVSAPGPGQYDLAVLDRIKGGSTLANRSSRFQDNKNEVPGPGSYNVASKKDKPSGSSVLGSIQGVGSCRWEIEKSKP